MTILANIAANVAAALVNVTTANDAASVVKFNALADFAASVAMRVRVEHINSGSNLETDNKGRIIAVVDTSKEQRSALLAALTGAAVGEKDAANIATMARTVSLWVVPHMINTGSIRIAKSGDEMRETILASMLEATGGETTYNAVEKARARKFAAPPALDDDTTEDAPSATTPDDLTATLDSAPDQAPSTPEPVQDPEETLDIEVSNAVRVIAAALERQDISRLIAQGFRPVLAQALDMVTEHERAEAQAKAEAEAAELEAKAQAKRGKAA